MIRIHRQRSHRVFGAEQFVESGRVSRRADTRRPEELTDLAFVLITRSGIQNVRHVTPARSRAVAVEVNVPRSARELALASRTNLALEHFVAHRAADWLPRDSQ